MRIETSTRCSCGTHVVLSESRRVSVNGGWDANCPNCYGPVEDSSDVEKVLGWGKTPDAALWDWQEQHDEAWGVEFVPADMFGELARQVSEERERQRGWKMLLATRLRSEVREVNNPNLMLAGPAESSGACISYGPEAA